MLVVPASYFSQWETLEKSPIGCNSAHRRFPSRLGSHLSRNPDWRCLDPEGMQPSYQLSRVARSLKCSPILLPGKNQHCGSDMDGQFKCSVLHQPHGRNMVISTGTDSRTILDLGSTERDHVESTTHSRCGECHGRQNVSNTGQRQVGLAVKPSCLLQDSSPLGSIPSRHVCDEIVNSPYLFFFLLETRTSSRSHRCFSSGLVNASGVCAPSLVPHPALPEKSHATESNLGDGNSPLVNSELVPNNSFSLNRLSQTDSTNSRSDVTHGQCRSSGSQSSHSTNRLAYFRESLKKRGVSAEAEELMLSAWRSSTNKNYDSAWRKWEGWCNDQNINPISAYIESVLSFLASQFHRGHQYR